MARARRRREQEVVRPAGPPPPGLPPIPPPWYRDVWPWLLALGLVVLAIIGGYLGYEAYQDNEDDEPEVVTVTTTETETDGETTTTETTTTEPTTTAEEPPEPVEAPDVIGLNQVEAGSTIEGAGLVGDSYPVASTEARGTVVAQRPAGGTQLKEGDTMRMNVALGEGAREAREVPDVTGPRGSDARATLRRAGFTMRTLYRQPPTSEEAGEVLTQQPAAGTSAPELTQVTIFVGRDV